MKIYSITYDKVLDLKRAANENFSDKIHFHDACGGQYFNLEMPNSELQNFIVNFFNEQGVTVVFADDNINFHLEKP